MDVLRYRTPAGADPVGKYLDRKQSRKAPPREIDTALARTKEVLSGE